MDLGKTIKDLRIQKKLTQEQLADYLSVSVQTVSRWETSVNYPDVTMLPILANIFDVTTDHLLGVDVLKNKEEIDKISREVQDLLHIGHLDDAVTALRKGIKQFPNNYDLLLKLCSTLNFYDEKNMEHLQESIAISERILQTTTDESIRKQAVSNLFFAYLHSGDKKSLRRVYDDYIASNLSVDYYSSFVFEGDELITHLQKNILVIYQGLWSDFMAMRKLDFYTDEEKIKILDKFNRITSVFFEDDDLGFYNWSVFTVNEKIAKFGAKQQDIDFTIRYLEKTADYAIKFDTRPAEMHRKSVLVNRTKDIRSDSTTNSKVNCSFELLEEIKDQRYDFVRNDPRLVAIISRLEEYAKGL